VTDCETVSECACECVSVCVWCGGGVVVVLVGGRGGAKQTTAHSC
jgi:hypothetical protein